MWAAPSVHGRQFSDGDACFAKFYKQGSGKFQDYLTQIPIALFGCLLSCSTH